MVMTVAGCAGTGGNAGSTDKSITVGAIYLDTQGFYGGVQRGVQDGAAENGTTVKVLESNAQDDASKESTFVSTYITANVNAILLSAASGESSIPAIKQAFDANIPVICYNTCIADESAQKYVYSYVFGDPVKFGEQIGQAAADYFIANNIAAPKIGVLNCEFVEVCVQRREGFENVLKEKVPGYTIVSNQLATDPTKSIDTATAMLTANPDTDAFFGESGGAAIGGVKAVEQNNRVGKTVVFGSDMTTDLANALVKGDVLKASVDVSGQAVGKLAIKAAIDAVGGVAKPASINVDAPIVLYTGPEDGKKWLEAHANGIP
ncbi:sugar ABC transporter substrate-binding protein [Subtercola boreus]|uniref:Sugar ABC transporter substrate-binding protein n=2 Tax=Subtercola boreus TaxID=120213 RepID=A0A3E0VBG0_9MICO|nr:sugar ABC transporter substrate-binding protein [Subtercola boreus]